MSSGTIEQPALADTTTLVGALAGAGYHCRTIGPHRDGTVARKGRRIVHVYGCGLITAHETNDRGEPRALGRWWDPFDALAGVS